MQTPLIEVVLPCVGINRDLPLVVECFLRQSWPEKRLHLVNVMGEIQCDHRQVTIHNVDPVQLPSVRHQIAYGFDRCEARWVCKWDSDDFYLPWFLEESIKSAQANPGWHVKPRDAWFVEGHPPKKARAEANTFEGCWTLDREILQPMDYEFERWYLDASWFRTIIANKTLKPYPQTDVKNYCYTWNSASDHFSGYYGKGKDYYQECKRFRDRAAKTNRTGNLGTADWAGWVKDLMNALEAAPRESLRQRLDAGGFVPRAALYSEQG